MVQNKAFKNRNCVVELTLCACALQFTCINSTKRQNLRLVQIESICRQQNKCDRKKEICFGKGRKYCGKRRKCWSPPFSPFPTMFSKDFFFKVVKSRDCVVKSYHLSFMIGY